MAGLLCPCGNGMSTIQCPNDYILHIWTDKEFDDITEKDADIIALDLLDYEGKYEYWHCPKCNRVSVVNRKNKHICRVYAIEKEYPDYL